MEIGHSATESRGYRQLTGYLMINHVVHWRVGEHDLCLATPANGGDFANVGLVVENLQVVANARAVVGFQNSSCFFAFSSTDFLSGLSVVIKAAQTSTGCVEIMYIPTQLSEH